LDCAGYPPPEFADPASQCHRISRVYITVSKPVGCARGGSRRRPPAAFYPQEAITIAVIDNELAPPAPTPVSEERPLRRRTCRPRVERYLNKYFGGFADGLPPPGLYHRILRGDRIPLALGRTCRDPRQTKSAPPTCWAVNRNTLRKKNPRFGNPSHPYQRVRGGACLNDEAMARDVAGHSGERSTLRSNQEFCDAGCFDIG